MKLEGIKVLDLSLFLPGPHFTMMMADHGAEVIKLEPPTGEPVREVGLKQGDESVWFRNTHRGKKSISLNLKHPEGKTAFMKLAAEVDVIVEAFRPGVVSRLGIDYDSIKAINPGIVYCSVSAYGQTGDKRLSPAHDLSIQADSGLVSVNLGADGVPAMPAMPTADMAGSLMAFSGILMALLRKQTTGLGDYLDVSMQDSLIAWTPNVMGPIFAENKAAETKQERSWGGNGFYNIYQTQDGKYLTLGGSEIKFVHNLLSALGKPEMTELAKQGPGDHQQPMRVFLREQFASKTLAEWEEYLAEIDVCWAPVRDLHSAMQEPHLQQRDMILTDEHGNKSLGVPIKFSEEPAQPNLKTPEFSADTAQILRSLGYSASDIERFKIDKAVF
ncbi:CoA transferase [Thalassotalea psychrophila]|uniref:CoA transferase n=1 Tax=Thalassotalea psychrophila TaxID=3065647 RepID=A0ABY9TWH9_9GAMM|nr:CoA transferase [Colwelliaceae bacterium SQ149]